MSVIVAGMDMLKHCYDCPICYDYMGCSITGNGLDWENCDKVRLENCPLKSIDGLIEKIQNVSDIEPLIQGGAYYGNRYKKADQLKNEIIEIIKEYCEVKE